jgi:DNA polymerase III epsilon subunit-like protein
VSLTDAQFELYQRLLRRPFLVLDTEYTHAPAEGAEDEARERLISVGLVPVVRGHRTATDELYVEMNPGVPITPETARIHGFTDAAVARKRPFAFYGQRILDALAVEDAVLVTHTAGDVRILAAELARAGLPPMPDLPLLDTSVLPRQLSYPGVSNRRFVSLATLTGLAGAANAQPHNARSDARATADALLALLRHAAAAGRYDDVDALLAGVDHGSSRAPRTSKYARTSRRATPLPPEHLAEHTAPMTHAGTGQEMTSWLDRAERCVELRCEHLALEASLAGPDNGEPLLRAVAGLLAHARHPGQAGTVAGAMHALIAPEAGQGVMRTSQALFWWGRVRPQLESLPRCGDKPDERCPNCRDGDACPSDVLYLPITDLAIYGETGELTAKRIDDRFLGSRPDRAIHKWQVNQRKELAYAMSVIATWLFERRATARAQDALQQAAAAGLPELEPRLALLQCEALAGNGELDRALQLAGRALARRTTDPAYEALSAWVLWQQQAQAPPQQRRAITHPRLARPEGRRNANPYYP